MYGEYTVEKTGQQVCRREGGRERGRMGWRSSSSSGSSSSSSSSSSSKEVEVHQGMYREYTVEKWTAGREGGREGRREGKEGGRVGRKGETLSGTHLIFTYTSTHSSLFVLSRLLINTHTHTLLHTVLIVGERGRDVQDEGGDGGEQEQVRRHPGRALDCKYLGGGREGGK